MDMPEPFGHLRAVDRLVHHPGRLTILTILNACSAADLPFLASASGLRNRNLSSHLSRLEEAGLVTIAKRSRGTRAHTEVSLTLLGRERVHLYWQSVDRALKAAWRSVFERPATPL
jgi:DNA-binding transcriptional ArsR family regulator